jgi:hypothetical protein
MCSWTHDLVILSLDPPLHHLDSISSRFNVLNMPISTTASWDAKTHVWPIDGIAQWLTNQRSILSHIQAKTCPFDFIGGYRTIHSKWHLYNRICPWSTKLTFWKCKCLKTWSKKIRSQKLGDFSGLLILLAGFSNWLTLAYFFPRKPII